MKRATKVKQKSFLITFKGLSLNQAKQFYLAGENPTLRKIINKKVSKATIVIINLLASI